MSHFTEYLSPTKKKLAKLAKLTPFGPEQFREASVGLVAPPKIGQPPIPTRIPQRFDVPTPVQPPTQPPSLIESARAHVAQQKSESEQRLQPLDFQRQSMLTEQTLGDVENFFKGVGQTVRFWWDRLPFGRKTKFEDRIDELRKEGNSLNESVTQAYEETDAPTFQVSLPGEIRVGEIIGRALLGPKGARVGVFEAAGEAIEPFTLKDIDIGFKGLAENIDFLLPGIGVGSGLTKTAKLTGEAALRKGLPLVRETVEGSLRRTAKVAEAGGIQDAQRLVELDAAISAQREIIKPPKTSTAYSWARSLTRPELERIAKQEGVNPRMKDWWDALDPQVTSEARKGAYKQPTDVSLPALMQERAAIRQSLKDVQAGKLPTREQMPTDEVQQRLRSANGDLDDLLSDADAPLGAVEEATEEIEFMQRILRERGFSTIVRAEGEMTPSTSLQGSLRRTAKVAEAAEDAESLLRDAPRNVPFKEVRVNLPKAQVLREMQEDLASLEARLPTESPLDQNFTRQEIQVVRQNIRNVNAAAGDTVAVRRFQVVSEQPALGSQRPTRASQAALPPEGAAGDVTGEGQKIPLTDPERLAARMERNDLLGRGQQALPDVPTPPARAGGEGAVRLTGTKVGDRLTHPQLGEVVVEDISDRALLTVRTSSGGSAKVGRGTFGEAAPKRPPEAPITTPEPAVTARDRITANLEAEISRVRGERQIARGPAELEAEITTARAGRSGGGAIGEPPKMPPSGAGLPIPPTPESGRRFLGELPTNEELQQTVWTASNRLEKWIIGNTGINPSVKALTVPEKAWIAYNRALVSIDALTDVAIGAAHDFHAQRFTGRFSDVFPVDKRGMWGTTGKHWEDVIMNPSGFDLTPAQRAFLDDMITVIAEVTEFAIERGVPIKKLKFPEGYFYFPRVALTKAGITLTKPPRPDLQRVLDEATDFVVGTGKDMNDWNNDIRLVTEMHVKARLRQVAMKELEDALAPFAITPKEIVPKSFAIRREQAIRNRLVVERTAKANIKEARRLLARPAITPRQITRSRKDLANLERVIIDEQAKMAKARMEFHKAKFEYSQALARARASETVKPELFGNLYGENAPKEIKVSKWKNRFYPEEMIRPVEEGLVALGYRKENFLTRSLTSTANTYRTMGFALDAALPFIQGQPLLATRPDLWVKMVAYHDLAFLDPTVQARFIREHMSTFQEMAHHGVPVGDIEFFTSLKAGQGLSPGALLEYLPKGHEARQVFRWVGKQTYGRAGAAYNMGTAAQRALWWEAERHLWKDPFEFAAYLRNGTGGLDSRTLGVMPTQSAAEAMWLAFSPKFLRSTISVGADAVQAAGKMTRGQAPTQRQRKSVELLGRIMAAGSLFYVLSGVALGKTREEIETGLNPLNGYKFMSHEVNGDWIGLGGQFRSGLQLIARITSALAPGGQPAGNLWSLSQYDNPVLSYWRFRAPPGMNVLGAPAEAIFKGDFIPFKRIDNLPDIAMHYGESVLPFAVAGRLEGEGFAANFAGLRGLRTLAGELLQDTTPTPGGFVSPTRLGPSNGTGGFVSPTTDRPSGQKRFVSPTTDRPSGQKRFVSPTKLDDR